MGRKRIGERGGGEGGGLGCRRICRPSADLIRSFVGVELDDEKSFVCVCLCVFLFVAFVSFFVLFSFVLCLYLTNCAINYPKQASVEYTPLAAEVISKLFNQIPFCVV